MILMDEFMVSGETIVRDLQHRPGRAAEPRRRRMRGRLPPRHVRPRRADAADPAARRPRARGGLARRARRRSTRTAFWWEAPDGSEVRAEYLYGSYSNGRDLPDDAEAARRARPRLRGRAGRGGAARRRHAADERHRPPAAPAVARARRRRGERGAGRLPVRGHVARRSTCAEQPTDGLTTWCGELRSGARANVLMGVASNRVDVHQARAARRAGARARAEPLERAAPPARRGTRRAPRHRVAPARAQQRARLVVRVQRRRGRRRGAVRYQEARQIGDGLAREALRQLATDDRRAPVVDHRGEPAPPHDRGGLIEVPLPGDGPVHLVASTTAPPARPRSCARSSGEGFSTVVVGQKIRWVLEMMRGPEFAGARIARVEDRTRPDGSRDVHVPRRRARRDRASTSRRPARRAARAGRARA